MSNIIEKITLYDILGYTIPGIAFLITLGWGYWSYGNFGLPEDIGVYSDHAGIIVTGLVFAGYLAGMLVSEMADLLTGFIKQWNWFQDKDELRDIELGMIAKALKEAKVIADVRDLQDHADVMKKHMGFLYGQVQSDAKYSRLHNYASAELICKNMAFVFFAFTVAAVFACQFYLALAGLVCSFLFMRRWRSNYWRKNYYVVVWFIQMYL
ncbi:MAG: hypothetical protein K2P45_11870 [Eubacterium sp.]|nr:hypothetical protein [Eubacterium sp.]